MEGTIDEVLMLEAAVAEDEDMLAETAPTTTEPDETTLDDDA